MMESRRPVWRPDGKRVTFQPANLVGGVAGVYEAVVGDSAAPAMILERGRPVLFPETGAPMAARWRSPAARIPETSSA